MEIQFNAMQSVVDALQRENEDLRRQAEASDDGMRLAMLGDEIKWLGEAEKDLTSKLSLLVSKLNNLRALRSRRLNLLQQKAALDLGSQQTHEAIVALERGLQALPRENKTTTDTYNTKAADPTPNATCVSNTQSGEKRYPTRVEYKDHNESGVKIEEVCGDDSDDLEEI